MKEVKFLLINLDNKEANEVIYHYNANMIVYG